MDYWPVLQQAQTNDLRTQSVFLNDMWRLNNRFSFNLGVRYDKNDATDMAGNVTANDSAFSPRLAATFDVKGDGKLALTASYAQYVAALQDTQAGSGASWPAAPRTSTGTTTAPPSTARAPRITSTRTRPWSGSSPGSSRRAVSPTRSRRPARFRRAAPPPSAASTSRSATASSLRPPRSTSSASAARSATRVPTAPTSSAANSRTSTTSRRTCRPARSRTRTAPSRISASS